MNRFLRGSGLTDFFAIPLEVYREPDKINFKYFFKYLNSQFISLTRHPSFISPLLALWNVSPYTLYPAPNHSINSFLPTSPPPYPHPSTFNLIRNKKLETRVHIYQWYKKTKLFSFADIHRICYKLEKRCIWGLDEQENEWLEIVELLPCYTMFCNYTYLQYIYLTCLFVCLYPIIVKTDVPSMPVFCGNSHVMAPGKVYVHHQWTKVPGKNVDI